MKIYKKIKHDKDITKYLPDYPEKKIPSRVYLCNILNTVYPNSIPLLVKKLKKLKVVERNAKMKKFVLVRKKFAASLRSFESKRVLDPEKVGRFVGLMQEDRKKNPKKRGSYHKIDFDFDLSKICKKMKRKHENLLD